MQGDLFGNSGKDNTQGMLDLSRMDPTRDPKNTRSDASEELKRRSLAQLEVKEGEDDVAEKEVRHRSSRRIDVPSKFYSRSRKRNQWPARSASIDCDVSPLVVS